MSKDVLIGLALYFASGLVNLVLARFTPEQIDGAVERTRWGHVVRDALRRFGLDVPGLIRLVQGALANRAATPRKLTVIK